jgi:2-amino-4-hydroxy-6-hydroxymethyldihydropteridine diphosphokinase
LIALGSNLGNRHQVLDSAVQQLQKLPDVDVVAVSDWIETAPVGGPAGQAAFVNGAVVVKTALAPQVLLQTLLNVEQQLGRQRNKRWEPRVIDLDLLLYGCQVIDGRGPLTLKIPHPWMAIRPFVLKPAAQVAADMVHPLIGWTVTQLWQHAQRSPTVLVILHGNHGEIRDPIEAVAQACGADYLPDPPSGSPRLWSSGLSTPQRIESLRARASAVISAVAETETKVMIFGYWWDQPVYASALSLPTAEGHDVREARDKIATMALAPNVTILPASKAPSDSDVATDTGVERDYAQPINRGPVLALNYLDTARFQHDLLATIHGFQG